MLYIFDYYYYLVQENRFFEDKYTKIDHLKIIDIKTKDQSNFCQYLIKDIDLEFRDASSEKENIKYDILLYIIFDYFY